MEVFQLILLGFLVVCAISVSLSKNLLNSILIYMSYSLVASVIWILLESPDLAITEAAVGAGITSVLFFVTLKKIHAMMRSRRMSRKIPEQQYEKTISYRFRQWLDGTKDPFLGTVEMKPQKEFHEDDTAVEKRKEEKKEIFARVFDTEHNAELRMFRKLYRLFSVLFCIGLVFVLLTGVSHLPPFGAADNPVNNEVPRRYIENGLQETGAVNIVTGMILDYRAFDTLGESHVLFVATCTVLILLRIDKKKGRNSIEEWEANDRIYEPKNDIILQTVAKLLVPPIMIFGIYVILCGHLGPGGGFSGGAVIGAGLILYLNAFGFAKTERFFTAKTYKWMSFGALACYALAKSYSFYTGANDIHSIIPLGTPGAILSSGLILLLNICVGIVVAGTMYTFYVMFRKGGY